MCGKPGLPWASSTNVSELCLMKCAIMFSASQMLEKSLDNRASSPGEAPWNISHDTLCSGRTFFFFVVYLNCENMVNFLFGVSSDIKNSWLKTRIHEIRY